MTICVYAINAGPGANVLLGCKPVTAMSGSPTGKFDAVKGTDGSVEVSGWAIDPDTTAATSVHVYIDSTGTALSADQPRSELATSHPAYGTGHGFAAKLPAAPGTHSVCAYAINVGPGGTTDLGCQTVSVPGGGDLARVPIGSFESVAVSGSTAVVTGWAIDPDTSAPIKVHIYVGPNGAEYTADEARPTSVRNIPLPGRTTASPSR